HSTRDAHDRQSPSRWAHDQSSTRQQRHRCGLDQHFYRELGNLFTSIHRKHLPSQRRPTRTAYLIHLRDGQQPLDTPRMKHDFSARALSLFVFERTEKRDVDELVEPPRRLRAQVWARFHERFSWVLDAGIGHRRNPSRRALAY